ncbi:two-component system chemotaxis family response regulator WspR [Methylopila capsulata]|uniref:diguanylate cyclase n=1 Tax=Methylopila capsulata TaxID=61654 RepID=A0A9W6MRW7_9HYPH|nr:diguanylate cyclase [Methylopila capsulata]MBM7850384.1 two-component system chemotaxis family response regulator WspR [Methylopila capsulata]GLK55677.1 diguanylate cyclase response regulator [Methylopila capsulata]
MTQEQDPIAMVVPPLADNYLSMVLLVDDQVLICEAVRRALADEPDIDLHYCTNSGDAVRTAQELKPTVILQDLVMPGIDGLDLLRTYRATPLLQAVPVIVLSAKDEASTKSDAFRAGANDYLVKLPDRIELIARIRHQTRAYLDHVQRDAAYNALRESQRQLMNANLELQRLTQIDGLTNLGNRRYFNEYMQAEWRRALRSEASIAVLMIDVDRFKGYNDAYGHLEGDEVLKRLAAIINTGASRASDLAARFGGEEFIVVLPGATIEGASAVADRLVRSVRELSISHGDGFVTISVGVAAMVPSVGTSARDLVNAADVALFRAKEAGRDRVEPYDGN